MHKYLAATITMSRQELLFVIGLIFIAGFVVGAVVCGIATLFQAALLVVWRMRVM